MICRECRHARRFAENGVYCVEYGMIISANHECTMKGAERRNGGDEDQREAVREETELQADGGGAFGEMPGLL